MTRKFKALGLALVAVFALSAVAASAASAAGHKFDTPGLTTSVVTANQDAAAPNQTLSTSGASVKCTTFNATGTVAQELNTTEVTAVPTYSNCKLGEEAATVNTGHCAYILTGDTDANGKAPTHVECAAGSEIVITTSLCTLHIGEQTPLGGVHYVDTTGASGKEEVTLEAKVTNIKYTKTGPFTCLFAGNGEDAVYEGKSTAGAFADSAAVTGTNLTTPASYTMGAQGNLKLTTNAT